MSTSVMRPILCVVVASHLLWSASVLASTPVYRWVDDQGNVHYADVVPDRYKNRARLVDAPVAQPSAEDQRAAFERVQRDKAKAQARLGASPESLAAPVAPPSAPSQSFSKRPAQVPNDRTDCATWQRLYEESSACFGPYRTVRGGVKPEAFEVCNVVQEPPPSRCRMRIP